VSPQDRWRVNSIDEVIEVLDEVLRWAAAERSRIGFFAAMYRDVTDLVRQGIANGQFDDGARMERLDVNFANRYLEALGAYRAGSKPTRSWLFSFETARMAGPLIVQHLLLGINAHINLDLGVATAETAAGSGLDSLEHDFQTINAILASRVSAIQAEISRVSPWFGLLRRVDPSADRGIINFSIERARDQAWTAAELLACLPAKRWPSRIDVLDRATLSLARLIRDPPGWTLKTGLRVMRLPESHDMRHVIEVLGEAALS